MFSYTDDAIVTSSPTGRHLSTVIRHPAGMPDDQWRKHADEVCTVLNELDSKAKANSLSLHLQMVGRVERVERGTTYEEYCCNEGLDPGPLEELRSSGPLASALASTRIAELEKTTRRRNHQTVRRADAARKADRTRRKTARRAMQHSRRQRHYLR